MKTVIAPIFVSALCVIGLLAGRALAADAEPMDIDVDVLAKMAKEKSRRSPESKNNNGEGSDRDNQACGSVDIGSVSTGSRPGRAPRNVTVVISGDVINANNNCR